MTNRKYVTSALIVTTRLIEVEIMFDLNAL